MYMIVLPEIIPSKNLRKIQSVPCQVRMYMDTEHQIIIRVNEINTISVKKE
jgi:hypothetical protein